MALSEDLRPVQAVGDDEGYPDPVVMDERVSDSLTGLADAGAQA